MSCEKHRGIANLRQLGPNMHQGTTLGPAGPHPYPALRWLLWLLLWLLLSAACHHQMAACPCTASGAWLCPMLLGVSL